MQVGTCQVESIETYEVKDLPVYNLELESLEDKDDLFYPDKVCKVLHHNCLRKDFGMINQDFPQTDMLLQAYKINEFMPKFYADLANSSMTAKKVGILGYTMKKDTDDTRDSLVPKLVSYINRYCPSEILINDPNLTLGEYDDIKLNGLQFTNFSIEEVMDSCDVVFIATNHTQYYSLDLNKLKGKLIIDIWNVLNNKLVFTA
jgi:UDP-N-acetyl-D-mannosaminuronate dehydrogenase